MTNTNVIPFPKSSKDVPSPKEAVERLRETKEDEIDVLVDFLSTSVIDLLIDSGFPVSNNESTSKDLCLVIESLRSLLMRFYEIEHPLQDIAQTCFDITEDMVIFNNPVVVKVKPEDVPKG